MIRYFEKKPYSKYEKYLILNPKYLILNIFPAARGSRRAAIARCHPPNEQKGHKPRVPAPTKIPPAQSRSRSERLRARGADFSGGLPACLPAFFFWSGRRTLENSSNHSGRVQSHFSARPLLMGGRALFRANGPAVA